MIYIGKDQQLLDFLTGDFTLISSIIKEIRILKKNEQLIAEIRLKLMYSRSEKELLLIFSDISEYSFYYTENNIFYNVERVKFFMLERGVYISFDPFEEGETIADDDQDFVKSKAVEGYWVS